MKKSSLKLNTIFLLVMFITALIPLVLLVCGFKGENVRKVPLANKPSFIKNGRLNMSFTADVENYVFDHIPLNGVSLRILDSMDTLVLKDIPGENAILGKDGFLFFGDTMSDQTGTDQLSEEEIASIIRYIDHINDICIAKGIRFCFTVAPDKGTVYPEKLPERLYITDTPRNIDLLTDALSEGDGDYFIDSKSQLIGVKQNGPCYYKRDTHWNDRGACYIYNAFAAESGLELFDAELYSVIEDWEGDLERYAAGIGDVRDLRYVYPESRVYHSEKPIDLDNNKTNITTSDANGLTVLVFHDSFGKALQPFLSQSAGKVVMMRSFPYDLGSLDEYSPDILLIEIAERKLPKLYELAKTSGY